MLSKSVLLHISPDKFVVSFSFNGSLGNSKFKETSRAKVLSSDISCVGLNFNIFFGFPNPKFSCDSNSLSASFFF